MIFFLSIVNIYFGCKVFLTFLISLQDLLQHFKGVGLTRCRAGLLVLLDHLVHLRFFVVLLHGEVRARAAVGGRGKKNYVITLKLYVELMCSADNVHL